MHVNGTGTKRTLSLQTKSLLLICTVFFIPFFLLSLLLYTRQSAASAAQREYAAYSITSTIGMNIDYLLYDLKQKTLGLYQNEDLTGFLTAKAGNSASYRPRLSAALSTILAYDKHIFSIAVSRLDGQTVGTSLLPDGDVSDDLSRILQQTGKLQFLKETEEMLVFSRKLNNVNNLEEPLGVVRVFVPRATVVNMIELNTQAGSGTFLLVDQVGNRIIPLSGVIPHGEDATHLSSLLGDGKRGTQYGTIGEEKMFASYYRMDNLDGLSLVFLSPRQFDLYLVRLLLVGLLGCGVVMIVVFSFWYERNIFRRLNRISHAMDTVEKDQFATTVVDTHADEISVLAESFNRMNTRLHELVNEVYVSKIREKESTIKTLRAYINPHFFFNTLDTICWMSRQENAFETCELVEALSTLFRSQLDAEYPIITVREEIDHVNQYLKIQNCRYAETIDFSVQCDDQCLTAMTVPSVIQPLVENAIYHGLEHSGSTGTIAITIRRTGEDLVIVVENTGEAVDADRLNELLSSYQEGKQGMAIYGINSRVKLQWGDAYGLGFTQRPGGGLVATIIQPFRERGVS